MELATLGDFFQMSIDRNSSGKPFGESDAFLAICNRISKGAFRPLPDSYSWEFRSTIQKILQIEAKNRPTTEELLEFPLFSQSDADVEEYYEEDFDEISSYSDISDNHDISQLSSSIDNSCSSSDYSCNND